MKRASIPSWPAYTVAVPEANVAAVRCRTVIGKVRPSWPPCATSKSRPRFWSMGRSMPRSSWCICSKCSFPCLHPGDTVILDNLATHKVQRVEQILQARDVALRYLPPYSPDLNPIEPAFSKLKAHLRQAAARTVEQLVAAVASSLDTFSAADCRAFFRHAQYASI